MDTLNEIRSFFAGDRFAALAGIAIDSAEDGLAVCSVELGEQHRNVMGHTQGGLIFTLADFAFAVAANSRELGTVTLNSTVHFLRAHSGGRLTAGARRTHQGRSVSIYEITVWDEREAPVARMTATGYRKAPGSGPPPQP